MSTLSPGQVRTLMDEAFEDWAGYLINPNFREAADEVSWPGDRRRHVKMPPTVAEVRELCRERQYSFQVAADHSILQLRYVFDSYGRHLTAACLAYYGTRPVANALWSTLGGPPDPGEVSDSEDGDDEEMFSLTTGDSDSFVSGLRVDYSPGGRAGGVLHHECHLHLSGFEDARIAISSVPNPRQFVEFAVALMYPADYRRMRLSGYGRQQPQTGLNVPIWSVESAVVEDCIMHLRVPTS